MSTEAKPDKRIRFAIYTRYSSEMQNELSLEAQEHRCRLAIADRGGVVVAVYSDSARSGWSLDRDGFTQLRNDAERGEWQRSRVNEIADMSECLWEFMFKELTAIPSKDRIRLKIILCGRLQ